MASTFTSLAGLARDTADACAAAAAPRARSGREADAKRTPRGLLFLFVACFFFGGGGGGGGVFFVFVGWVRHGKRVGLLFEGSPGNGPVFIFHQQLQKMDTQQGLFGACELLLSDGPPSGNEFVG